MLDQNLQSTPLAERWAAALLALCVLCLTWCPQLEAAPSQPPQYKQPVPHASSTADNTRIYPGFSRSRYRLSTSAYEVAKDLELLPSFQEYVAAKTLQGQESLTVIRLRQQLLETILVASFEIRSALSRIDDELAQTNELHAKLEDRRERSVQKSDIANFSQSGVNEILSTGLADFNATHSLNTPGGVFGVLGGAAAIAISAYSVHLNKGPVQSSPTNPNMLSEVFGNATDAVKFPPGVWNFLNDPRPDSPAEETRRVFLIREWVRLRRIKDPTTEQGRHRIALLTGQIPQIHALDLDLLEDRALMLSDLRATVSQMDQAMLEIILCVRNL